MAIYNNDPNNIGFGFGFNVSVGKPLDSRIICDDISDFESFNKGVLYKGMVIYVINDQSLYVCTNTNSTNSNPAEWLKLVDHGGAGDGTLRFISTINSVPTPISYYKNKINNELITEAEYNELPDDDKSNYELSDTKKVLVNGSYIELFNGMILVQIEGANKYPWAWYNDSFIILTQRGDIFDEYWQGLIYAGL